MKNKVIYIHRKKTNGEIFYIGMGNPDRPYQKYAASRSVVWHRIVNKHGYVIEVIRKDLTKQDALNIEMDLIELIGRRDLALGTLVNLTDGGDGVTGNGTSCYNIETGKIYKTIGEAAIDLNQHKQKIINQLNGHLNLNINNPIRTFENPYPEDTLPKNTIYLEDLKNFDVAYCNNLHSLDDKQAKQIKYFYSLDLFTQKIIEMSYYSSTREIAEELNVNYGYIHKYIHKGLKKILKENYHLYKNSSLKHLKNT
jgi:hypothetical protein